MENKYYREDTIENIFDYLRSYGIEPAEDIDNHYQLKTNLAIVFTIKNGEIALVRSDFYGKGLIISSKEYLEEMIRDNYFPIENSEKTIFEEEKEIIKNFKANQDLLFKHICQKVKKTIDINENEDLNFALKSLMKSRKKNVALDYIALGYILGEKIISNNVGYKWILVEHYGDYNPYLEPCILTDKNKVINIFNYLYGRLKWKISDVNTMLFDIGIYDPKMDISWLSYNHRIIAIE